MILIMNSDYTHGPYGRSDYGKTLREYRGRRSVLQLEPRRPLRGRFAIVASAFACVVTGLIFSAVEEQAPIRICPLYLRHRFAFSIF